MSRRRSTGDLVPRDITEILAREARAQRGQRKTGSSLGQAFSWLKGSRKKKSVGNGLNRTGVSDAKLGLHNQDPSKTAGPKGNEEHKRLTVHYTTSQHYQENVFIEGSRPQYLEDLHTEAQEGLKILQQEEIRNGGNFPDDESIASTDSLRPEQDISSKDKDCSSESKSTISNADITVTSAVSTRPVLTRQGSTFKPLNPVKRLEKSRKRNRRTTIMGIPNQVQKELALHRSSTFQPLAQPSNQDGQISDSQLGVVVITTGDRGKPVVNKEGARVNLSELEASSNQQLLWNHLQAVYQDEETFNHKSFGSHLCPTSILRPKSLAVPGLITSSSFSSSMPSFLQEPQGPVMSISPQATYMSTIIPNAVLPASIEVIEIDHSSSRTRGSSVNQGSSVRTVSKSSLASGDLSVSPVLSRKSDDDVSQTVDSHNSSTLMPTSASGSNWSKSQSSETIISNPSPVSSKGSARSSNSRRAGQNGDQDLISFQSSHSEISGPRTKSENITALRSESGLAGSVTVDEEAKNKGNSSRSLSVTKTKQPPAPPRRTNSLHNSKIMVDSRVLDNNKGLNNSVSKEVTSNKENITVNSEINLVTLVSSPVSNPAGSPNASSSSSSAAQVSSGEPGGTAEPQPKLSNTSPRRTPTEGGKFERTMSPSSGYSSQSGTPTLSPKAISPSSPHEEKKKPIKPERSVSRPSSSAGSPSSSLTSLSSGTSEPVNPDVSTHNPSLPLQGSPDIISEMELTPNNISSTLRAEFRELLNIPPPPKVKAPCPPPPETWVHNRRTFELLCGPFLSVNKVTQKQDRTGKQTGTQTEASKEMKDLADKQTSIENSFLSENKVKSGILLTTDPESVYMEPKDRECPGVEQDKVEGSADIKKEEQHYSTVLNDPVSQEAMPKKDPPPVMKKPTLVSHRREHSTDRHQKETSDPIKVNLPVENHTASRQDVVVVLVEVDKSEVESMESLSAEVPMISKASPPPTPPPAYHPTPPPSRKTPPSSLSMLPDELQKVQEEIHIAESCWPPPPPPLEGDPVFDGEDEVDFPPPPPLFVTESMPDVVDSFMSKLDVSQRPTEELGVTVEDSSIAGETVHIIIPNLAPAVSQPAATDGTPKVVLQVSENDTADKLFCQLEENVLESVSLPPVEASSSAIINPENLVDVSALNPSSGCLRRDSVKFEDKSAPEILDNAQLPAPNSVPLAPPLPSENLTHGVNFRRQPSLANRDTRSKELLLRHRSAPIPKEDANIPLVTPSLLQMVRLRSVNMTEDQVNVPTGDKSTNKGAVVQDNCPESTIAPQKIPQKPIRKSLSIKSPPQTVKTSPMTLSTPSMRLQEAIRMKTAAMSSKDSLPSRMNMRSQTYSCVSEAGALFLKSPEGCDMNKSPASTASFIFSRSTKKVVVETPAPPSTDAQASMKHSLAAELMEVSDQSRASAFSNGGVKCDKVPPPVAKKPAHGSIILSQNHPTGSGKKEFTVEGNRATEGQHTSGLTPPETATRVTADTIETLF